MSPEILLHLTPSISHGVPFSLFNENEGKSYAVTIKACEEGIETNEDTESKDLFYQTGVNNYAAVMLKTKLDINKWLSVSVFACDANASVFHSCATVSLKNMSGSCGTIFFTLVNHLMRPVGYFKADYIVIGCWQNPRLENPIMKWKSKKENSRPLLIGHRGCGAHRRTAGRLENTIASFTMAQNGGADFVELDVQLTNDDIPVVFHDYTAHIYLHQKDDTVAHICRNISDLTHLQWTASKIAFEDEDATIGNDVLMVTDSDMAPFPTLKETFGMVDQKLGFLIEVKYPMEEETGRWEASHPPDKNEMVDSILDVVYEQVGNREVIFCCFDPEICILLRRKQTRFGVMFNCCLENTLYTPYADKVSQTFQLAREFAVTEDLMGISVLVDAIIDDLPSAVKSLHRDGLTLYTWGDRNSEQDVVVRQLAAGIDGVVYDNIDEIKLPEEYQ